MRSIDELLRAHEINIPSTAPGRYYTTCPQCSPGRMRSHQKSKVLGVTINGKGARWGCNHCGWTGPLKGNGADRGAENIITYDYLDENGVLLFQKVRAPRKHFYQRKPDGRGGWINNLSDVRKVIYRLPEVNEATAAGYTIVCVEGEKDADNLWKIGVPATCNPDGAAEPDKKPKWRPEYSEMLRGADVVVIPDNDEAGRAHADATAKACAGITAQIRILDLAKLWPDCPKGGDISDWLKAGHTREQFDALITQAPAANPTTDDFLAFWHGDVAVEQSRPWLVDGTIPEVGCGLLSGQWGTYKTFTAIDLACAAMSGTPIFESEIDRPGGALLYAAEGQTEVPIRLQVSLENRCPHMAAPGKAPFAWLTPEKFPLKLLDPESLKAFIARAQKIGAEMRRRFGVPLVLIEIDTVVTTAGFRKAGDEDDAVIGAQVIEALKEISTKTGAFVLGVDHFGKSAETGTRGSSAKEANVDVVLATLGDRSLSGVVTNPRLAVRKVRGGIVGREYAFTTDVAKTGTVDPKGRDITTLKIIWSGQSTTTDASPKDKKDAWSKSLRLLRKILMNLLADCGKDVRPYTDAATVRAVDKEIIRREFYKEHPAEGETDKQKQAAKRQAFNRSLKDAQAASLIGFREIEGIEYVWLAKAEQA
jgi:AAA domain